ncbi:hypothetical protein [Micromonospora sp. DT41]|uniref:hypothetical protein n=1 Tax=Micromonospora sp. DT41 TaxID=3393437 RepID=UPI003CF4E233
MTVDPAVPRPESEPATQAHPPTDPWAAEPPTAALAAMPPTAPFPATPFPATPQPAAPFPAAAIFGTPPAAPAPTAQFPAAPAQSPTSPAISPAAAAPFSAPPVSYSAPPASYSAPPASFSGPPAQTPGAWPAVGPYPPVAAYPAATAGFAGPEVVAVQIAEIAVSPPVIRTPAGVLPLAGASWHVADYWQREEKIATWALVCAIVGFFCVAIFSLLFLLVKETRHRGTVQVTVTNGVKQYVARIPVSDQGQVQHINNQVNYARSLSSR